MAKILIVEDDPALSTTLDALLRGHGHLTRVESNGAAALLAAHEDLPALILMGMAMPILDGQETLAALRHDARTAQIPIIVIAGQEDDHAMAAALTAGANLYLTTPLEQDGLLALLTRLLPPPPTPDTTRPTA